MDYITSSDAIPMNEWTKVDIAQFRLSDGRYQLKISVGGIVIRDIVNNDPREFKDVKVSGPYYWKIYEKINIFKVYTSDNYTVAAKALIRNLRIARYSTDSK